MNFFWRDNSRKSRSGADEATQSTSPFNLLPLPSEAGAFYDQLNKEIEGLRATVDSQLRDMVEASRKDISTLENKLREIQSGEDSSSAVPSSWYGSTTTSPLQSADSNMTEPITNLSRHLASRPRNLPLSPSEEARLLGSIRTAGVLEGREDAEDVSLGTANYMNDCIQDRVLQRRACPDKIEYEDVEAYCPTYRHPDFDPITAGRRMQSQASEYLTRALNAARTPEKTTDAIDLARNARKTPTFDSNGAFAFEDTFTLSLAHAQKGRDNSVQRRNSLIDGESQESKNSSGVWGPKDTMFVSRGGVRSLSPRPSLSLTDSSDDAVLRKRKATGRIFTKTTEIEIIDVEKLMHENAEKMQQSTAISPLESRLRQTLAKKRDPPIDRKKVPGNPLYDMLYGSSESSVEEQRRGDDPSERIDNPYPLLMSPASSSAPSQSNSEMVDPGPGSLSSNASPEEHSLLNSERVDEKSTSQNEKRQSSRATLRKFQAKFRRVNDTSQEISRRREEDRRKESSNESRSDEDDIFGSDMVSKELLDKLISSVAHDSKGKLAKERRDGAETRPRTSERSKQHEETQKSIVAKKENERSLGKGSSLVKDHANSSKDVGAGEYVAPSDHQESLILVHSNSASNDDGYNTEVSSALVEWSPPREIPPLSNLKSNGNRRQPSPERLMRTRTVIVDHGPPIQRVFPPRRFWSQPSSGKVDKSGSKNKTKKQKKRDKKLSVETQEPATFSTAIVPHVGGEVVSVSPSKPTTYVESSDVTAGTDIIAMKKTIQNGQMVLLSQVQGKAIKDPYGDAGTYTGIMLEGLPHGEGTMDYSDGRSYTGEWRRGRWHGQGRARFVNGDTFTGRYERDRRHGKGRYEWSDGRVYEGDFVRNQRHGHGHYTWPDGASYVGEFANGQRHGEGRYCFADGSVYQGEWKSGKYDGIGECVWASGRKYHGEWKAGKAEGFGIEYRPDGSIRHEGEWKNDRPLRKRVDP